MKTYVNISKTDEGTVMPGFNFKVNEFHPNASPYMNNQSSFPDVFKLSDVAIKGAQAIRSYYDKPVRVNASGRTKVYNQSIGGSSKSEHLLGQFRGAEENTVEAVDLDFFNKSFETSLLKDFHAQILNGGPLRDTLQQLGITGVGLYDNFMHIDSGHDTWTVWDNRVSTKGEESIIESYFGNAQQIVKDLISPSDDGLKDYSQGVKKKPGQILIFLAIVVVLILLIKRYS